MTIFENLLNQHTGKWFEVVVFAKSIDDGGEIAAKFINNMDALIYAKKQADTGIYFLVVVR